MRNEKQNKMRTPPAISDRNTKSRTTMSMAARVVCGARVYGRFGSPPRCLHMAPRLCSSLGRTGSVLRETNPCPAAGLSRSSTSVATYHVLLCDTKRDARGYASSSNLSNGTASTASNNAGTNGNYWSATENNSSNAWNLNFNSGNANVNNNNKSNGRSVRLFREGICHCREDCALISVQGYET